MWKDEEKNSHEIWLKLAANALGALFGPFIFETATKSQKKTKNLNHQLQHLNEFEIMCKCRNVGTIIFKKNAKHGNKIAVK